MIWENYKPTPLVVLHDTTADELVINGVRYCGDIFRGLSSFPIGTLMEITSREGGLVGVTYHGSSAQAIKAEDAAREAIMVAELARVDAANSWPGLVSRALQLLAERVGRWA